MGGSGLVGRALLEIISQDLDYAGVTAIGRRELQVPGVHSIVREGAPRAEDIPGAARVAFCCLGTTIKVAGSQDAFRAVDHGLVLDFARAALGAGVRSFHVVSSLGADPRSRVFYNRVKGEMERDLAAVGFESVCAYRPSFLLGDRDTPRPGERFGVAAAKALRPILPHKLRAIPAKTVAKAMAMHAKKPCHGVGVHTNEDLWSLAGASASSPLR